MKIFDTHAHYDDEAFDKDRDELLTSLFSGDIGAVVNVEKVSGLQKNMIIYMQL